jgi:SAM-dependent methyltransferase
MNDEIAVFDRQAVQARRNRAAADLATYDFLIKEVAARLVDRLHDIARTFPLALDLGCHSGQFADALKGSDRVGQLVQADLSEAMLRRASGRRVVANEELLPFRDRAFDLIASTLTLHWVNDLPGTLVQARRCLRPDGLFLAAILGGDTLWELRDALIAAEIEVAGGTSPRVSPMADLRDAGGLLQRAGFALPVADGDRLTLTYANPFALLRELRGLGETNATMRRTRRPTRRAMFEAAARIYHERHAGPDGRIPATFDVIYMTGWAPHESQQKPLPPGSASQRLADSLGTTERPAGERAGPRR